ncbi:MAG: hypothetical protein EOP87_02295 [Verrucomicrobiaceae bacterium]|nr:MAG: hypothetical protein EOP87_02295 [Verrucomicrobiaceae bacterium]
MQPRWILPVSTLCAGIAFGFITGKGTVPHGKAAGAEDTRERARPSRAERLSSESASAVRSLVSGGTTRDGGVVSDYSSLSPAQLAREFSRLEQLPTGERASETLLLFARWGEVGPLAALARARAMGIAGEAARWEALKGWSKGDPRAAADWFAKNAGQFAGAQPGRSVSEREMASSVIARAWARQDPEAALAWAATLGPEAGRSMSSIFGETAIENPSLAIRLAEASDPSLTAAAFSEIAWQWAAKDFPAAEQWIRTLPADRQDAAMARAITSLALSDPEKAAARLDSMPEGLERERSVGIVMRQLANEDTAAAERWLGSQSTDTARRSGAISLVSAMAIENPAGARNLLEILPSGPARDGAAAAYIRSSSSGTPEELLKIAGGLTNDADRGQSIALIITRWKQQDAEAAERYIMENFGNTGAVR